VVKRRKSLAKEKTLSPRKNPLRREKVPSPKQKSFVKERKRLIQGKNLHSATSKPKKTRSRIDHGSKTIWLKKEKISPEIPNLS